MRRLPRIAALAVVPASLALLVTGSAADVVPVRTLLISRTPPAAPPPNGASANPSLSADARLVVFDSAATNLAGPDPNGTVRDVFGHDLRTGRTVNLSEGANGPSARPSVSASGEDVAFESAASNLWSDDVNRTTDVFHRDWPLPARPVSVDSRSRPANGPSFAPAISATGRYVAFVSRATNLVANDRNGAPDVFRHDLVDGDTIRVSVASSGREANGASGAPAISANGRVVVFASDASNLVARDTNRTGDVFVRLIGSRRTRRVSVSSSGRQQNRSVPKPFLQLADVSGSGRYVVFDSDATNLVARDANRRTDIFFHDRRTGETRLISASSVNRQGNNDSVAPRITRDGRRVAFQSFAGNLVPGDGPGADTYLRDVRLGVTSIVDVPARGGRRQAELVAQLLQRPDISDSGTRVAFTSTARGLFPGEANPFEDVFLRLLAPPRTRLVGRPRAGRRPSVTVSADDPLATRVICRIDARTRLYCPRGRIVMPSGLSPGRHVLGVRAGGPGMAFDPAGLQVPVVVRRR